MEARSLTVSTSTKPAAHRANGCGCGCGCDEPHDVCCGLDCITAPRYFCGQLLTDQDLDALVDWTRAKARLARYRHGWGVVCGLDVHCHPSRPGTIVVAPGYAVSCCGDDVVVCEDAELDLSTACVEDIDPCGELRERPRARPVDRPLARTTVVESASAPGGGAPQRAPEPFDVYIAYEEQPADLRPALARRACAETAECEHARVRETYRLSWRQGGTGDPVSAAATRWKEGYDQTLDVLDAFEGAFATLDDDQADTVRAWFLRWIDRYPLHHFCFVRDRLCNLDDKTLTLAATISELLFLLVQDRRNAYLSCACFGCAAGTAVPLARVWIEPPQGGMNGGCHVAAIDPYWPYRREIGLDCWPAPPGSVNLGQLIWHRQKEACLRLADLGVTIDAVADWEPPEDLGELRRVLECSPFVPCGESRRLVVYEGVTFDRRVIGFCESTPQGPPPSLTLSKSSDLQEARPGTSVDFSFAVTNQGTETFGVNVVDDVLGHVGDAEVAAGATETLTMAWTVPATGATVTNTATAVATNNGGQTRATATHSFQILGGDENEKAGVDVRIDAPSEAEPTQVVAYKVVVSNPGEVDLRVVTAEDAKALNLIPQAARDGFGLAVGESREFGFELRVPREVQEVIEEVHAIGQTALGTEVRHDARHGMTVLGGQTPGSHDLRRIAGIGAARATALEQANIRTLEDLVQADARQVAEIVGGGATADVVSRWQAEATELLGR